MRYKPWRWVRLPLWVLLALLTLEKPVLAQEPAEETAPAPEAQTAPAETAPAAESSSETAATAPAAEATPEPAPANPDEAQTTAGTDTIPVSPLRTEAELPGDGLGDGPGDRLDEVTVSAQKRGNEAIKDVPISISVVDEELIFDWGITNVREVMLFVPNVKVEEAGFFMLPRIRGFSTNNNNKAFEPPAGVALDGIPYGRVEYFNAGLFDIQRIEVLRGPQGTTFGKNTTAGLIHIISKDPTENFNGFVDLQRGEYERERLEFGLGGEIIEGFMNMRIAGMSDTRRGFVYNTTSVISPQADEYLQGKDNSGFRAKFQFPDLAGSSLKLSYESLELGSLGSGIEAISLTETMQATLRKYDPEADFIPGNFKTSLDYPDRRLTDIQTVAADWSYALGEWNLAAIGGQSVMESSFFLDTDFSPAPAILGTGYDRAPTTTLELRALSPSFQGLFGLGDSGWGDSDLLIGFFSQRTAIEDGYFDFALPVVPFLDLTAAAESSGGSTEVTAVPLILSLIPPNSLFLEEGVTEAVRQFFDQHSRTEAVFAQAQWRFIEDWNLQLAGRYSREKKDAHWDSVYTTDTGVLLKAAGIDEFTADRARQDEFFQPKVSLNWQPTGELSLFVHWARSFKSGGFNAFAFRNVDDQLQFGPEFTREWGADIKGTFFDRTVKVNLSAYNMEVEDFQVLTREPQQTNADPQTGEITLSTIGLGITKVINAPRARARGIEGDVTWLAASWLRWFMTVGINDTEFLDHKKNDCAPDKDAPGQPFCDATGKPFAFAPKYNGSITAAFTAPWTLGGVEFSAAASSEYASWQYTDIDLDDRKIQPAYWRHRASLGFGNSGQGWSFKLIGENLTDKVSYIRQGDLAPKQFVGITEPPRQIYGQFRWTF